MQPPDGAMRRGRSPLYNLVSMLRGAFWFGLFTFYFDKLPRAASHSGFHPFVTTSIPELGDWVGSFCADHRRDYRYLAHRPGGYPWVMLRTRAELWISGTGRFVSPRCGRVGAVLSISGWRI